MSDGTRNLALFDALPDLLSIARQRGADDVYDLQEKLRREYRSRGEAIKWSMPLRHFRQCEICGAKGAEIKYELENPKAREGAVVVQLYESEVHCAREHGGGFSSSVTHFFDELVRTSTDRLRTR
jgi:hypothetical protein